MITNFLLYQKIIKTTVKLVYKDHPRDQHNVVLIHRWSLYTGSINGKHAFGDL